MFRERFLRIISLAVIGLVVYFVVVRNHRFNSHQSIVTHPSQEAAGGNDSRGRHTGTREGRGGIASVPRTHEQAVIGCGTEYFTPWQWPEPLSCEVQIRNGFPVPDPRCTPGGVNPALTVETLRGPSWRTRAIRNCATSESQKHIAYRWYGVHKPRVNSNENQVCELDHLVPLELGGADDFGNIWPECGPDNVALRERYFKRKDRVENYLAAQVRSGRMSLDAAQRGIATDWTQYLKKAEGP